MNSLSPKEEHQDLECPLAKGLPEEDTDREGLTLKLQSTGPPGWL